MSTNAQNIFSQLNSGLPALAISNAAWTDYNGDGYIDVLLTGRDSSNGSAISVLYRNEGNNKFNKVATAIFTPITYGYSAWADFNGDTKPDVCITGFDGSNSITKLYVNNGDDSFSEFQKFKFYGLSYSYVAWADYDKDGDMDLATCGYNVINDSYNLFIYVNTGTSFEQSFSLVGVRVGSISWGDLNKDGYPDLLICGFTGFEKTTTILLNNGAKGFMQRTDIILTAIQDGKATWADIENDGDLDIILVGKSDNGNIAEIYKNDNGNFTLQSTLNLYGLKYASLVFDDINNDGLKDLLYIGFDNTNNITKVYLNGGNGSLVESSDIILDGAQWGSISLIDGDNDGDNDLFIIGSIENTPGKCMVQFYVNSTINTGDKNQKITFSSFPTTTYGDASFTPSVIASSGLPVEIYSANTSVADTANGKIVIKKSGSVYIKAFQEGNADFNPKTDSQLLVIKKKDLSITANNQQKSTGADNPVLSVTYKGFVNGDDASLISGLSISTTATKSSPPGDYSIILQGGSAENYNLKLTNGILKILKATLFVVADRQERLCGESNKPFTVSYFGFLNGDDESVLTTQPNIYTSAAESSNAGEYPIIISGTTATNYTISHINGVLYVKPLGNQKYTVQICSGSSYTLPSGKIISDAGVYYDTISSVNGCDSLNIIEVNVLTAIKKYKDVGLCHGQSYFAQGSEQTEPGLYFDTLRSASGCDSLYIETQLTVQDKPTVNAGADTSICNGNSVTLKAKGTGNVTWVGYNSNEIVESPVITKTYTAVATSACGTAYDNITVDVYSKPETPKITLSDSILICNAVNEIQWHNSAGIIDGENDWKFMPKVTGDYFAIAINGACLSKKSETIHVEINVVSSIVANANSFRFYPNPAWDFIHIESPENIARIEIFNSIGSFVKGIDYANVKNAKISVSFLNSGLYMIKIISNHQNEKPIVRAFIKN